MNIVNCKTFFPVRKYIQFGDLVIDNFSMLKSADLSGGFKTISHSYTFRHGSYSPQKNRNHLADEQKLSMTLEIDTRKFSREQRIYFMDFLHHTISRPNRLWAIEGEQILWAHSKVTDFSKPYQLKKNFVAIDLDFLIYEGVWHKADPRKVFLKPYDLCNFADCLDFRDDQECLDCCVGCIVPHHTNACAKCTCDCDYLTKEDSLCELRKSIANDFYKQCGDTFQLFYNCEAGKRLWGEEKMLGHKICKKEACHSIIAGRFYSGTILETDQVTVTLKGSFKNPRIKINDNEMIVQGEYNGGKLTIDSSCDLYFEDDECCQPVLVANDKLVIEKNNTLGFTVHHGENSVIVETDNCCDVACVYIKVDPITL